MPPHTSISTSLYHNTPQLLALIVYNRQYSDYSCLQRSPSHLAQLPSIQLLWTNSPPKNQAHPSNNQTKQLNTLCKTLSVYRGQTACRRNINCRFYSKFHAAYHTLLLRQKQVVKHGHGGYGQRSERSRRGYCSNQPGLAMASFKG